MMFLGIKKHPLSRIVFFLLFNLIFKEVNLRADEFFPIVNSDLKVSLYAENPLVRNPCALTFDSKGRLFVGMGPQYRKPKPETQGDSVWLLVDDDNDGKADRRIQFATGFNSIQGLAWNGSDLWIANAPDMTIVRDLDGDDIADEYVRIWTDLGNLEHGIHGLNFGPDGKLYMSKGNSKGLTHPPERLAPRAFRQLWDVDSPELPEAPPPRVSDRAGYKKNYHNPNDDWGRQGGILRCNDDGSQLEIFSYGFRNPWDITYDDAFNWLGTDNDQNIGDKIFSPFYGAHFGWGHSWSYDWVGENHLPTAPANGPFFEGSGTGVIYCGLKDYPDKYRGVFFINDWLRREVYIYRPRWEGARMLPTKNKFDVLVHAGGGRSMGESRGRKFSPVDIEIGPDGAIYISSWGREYGLKLKDGKMANEGRIYRIWPSEYKPNLKNNKRWLTPVKERSLENLLVDLGSHLPAIQGLAQKELIRRGSLDSKIYPKLMGQLNDSKASIRKSTWLLWTLARLKLPQKDSLNLDATFSHLAKSSPSLLTRVQATRILGFRGVSLPLNALLKDEESRIRFEALLSIRNLATQKSISLNTPLTSGVVDLLAVEQDRLTYYAGWGALLELLSKEQRTQLLDDRRPQVRRGALLSLLERDELSSSRIHSLTSDPDMKTQELAKRYLAGKSKAIIKGPPLRPANRTVSGKGAVVVRPPAHFIKHIESVKGPDALYTASLLYPGVRTYNDRSYTLKEVPKDFLGDVFIQTSNDDGDRREVSLKLTLSVQSEIYVAHDQRLKQKPAWLQTFEKTEISVTTSDAPFLLYKKRFPNGEVRIGPNRDDQGQGGSSNYFVIVKPQLVTEKEEATPISSTVKLLEKGNKERGRDLFLSNQGAGCANCHRLEGIGNNYAPDLSEIRKRASKEFIVESILKPSEKITEGFVTQVVTTKTGTIIQGIIVQETGRSVSLAQVGGEVIHIPKNLILLRKSSEESAMPDFSTLLSGRDVADIVAYLYSELSKPENAEIPKVEIKNSESPKITTKNSKDVGTPTKRIDQQPGIRFLKEKGKLVIVMDGWVVGSYQYQHPKTKRPFFSNLYTLGDKPIKVSRNFPPIKGKDVMDHSSYHPGIWLAFGDIGGADVWRMKAEVKQVDLLKVNPGKNQASFKVRNHYLKGDLLICEEECTYSIVRVQDGYWIGYDSVFSSKDQDFYFGDQEEMGLGIRISSSITVKNGGAMLNNLGERDEAGTWGKAAHWLDYFGTIEGREVGMMLMGHPENFRQPWFHSRNYGACVLNPFGRKAMKKGPVSKLIVKKGESFRFRAAVFIHGKSAGKNLDRNAVYNSYVKFTQAKK